MVNEHIILAYYLMWGLLVFTTVCFLISGLDDLFFDIVYWLYFFWRKWVLRKAKPLLYERIMDIPQKRIAVMIPCWHEAGVIEVMLKYNTYNIDYEKYDLFVGVYPNDPHTVAAVQQAERELKHVKCVIGPENGPTNKAKNLNAIFAYISKLEEEQHIKYDIFILHDSEDIIHALSFKLYNYLIPKNDMVQIPIFPLYINLTELTHWIYAAEFSEAHTKDMVVREQIGGLVPSAGVGTAFSRDALYYLKKVRGGVPFATDTLTEDYSTALQIRLHGMREIFASQFVYRTRWRKKWFLFGKPVPYVTKEYIATRALFPTEYTKSVRQKTRWVLGIAFQEWINSGWQGNVATLYTLLHDRKSLFTHLITGLFFVLMPFWLLYSVVFAGSPDYPTLQDQFELHPWVWNAIIISSYLMIVRIIERMIATYRIYGFFPAIFSAPLILYGNVINLHALLRAYYTFIFSPAPKPGTTPAWDKTDHVFPAQHVLLPYRYKLGDLLVKNNIITSEQLAIALKEQVRHGEPLGDALLKLHFISQAQLTKALAEQYDLTLIPENDVKALPFSAIPHLSKFTYDRLLTSHCIPIRIHEKKLVIAINNPSDELLIAAVMNWIKPYEAEFVLIDIS